LKFILKLNALSIQNHEYRTLSSLNNYFRNLWWIFWVFRYILNFDTGIGTGSTKLAQNLYWLSTLLNKRARVKLRVVLEMTITKSDKEITNSVYQKQVFQAVHNQTGIVIEVLE
jgi:hypothetical protein